MLWSVSLMAIPAGTTTLITTKYLTVEAQSGDGVIVLLNRYQLYQYACNESMFYKINDLTDGDPLKLGHRYKLPVRIVTYNGQSIRSTLGISDWEQAVAIRDWNNRLKMEGLRQKNFTDDKELWVPYHLEHCLEEAPRPVQTQATGSGYTIFGDKYKSVSQLNNDLIGQYFYIVSGHGGPDPGAQDRYRGRTISEDEYAYDVALRLARRLIQYGATVYVIVRDDDGIRDEKLLKNDRDEYVWGDQAIPADQVKRLNQRSDAINKLYKHNAKFAKSQTAVMIHIDSRVKSNAADVFFLFQPGDDKGASIAQFMHSTIKTKYEKVQPGRGYTGRYYARDLHMLRETKCPSVYVELGNIKNPLNKKRLILAENRQALANWMADGLRQAKVVE